ncbi:MAG: transglutaminase domain-containing protein, partial [Muribaculaceae bacterium]|nr:transglutaminase domain-containing protein [Muribaculaceae bacterium]
MKQLLYALAASSLVVPAIASDYSDRLATIPCQHPIALMDSTGVMNQKEREAMEFLYSYMPFPDIACHPASFYLDNVRASLQARAEMPWGATVPEREFRHFVLPVRVNNEDLDSSRVVFYRELRDRVKNLSMKDAILEVNHWCHEKVAYQPSDPRTSSPLATVRTALGRCGEESTFTVAALRSVGIPARQVYTPRWAHTDDNHAWVEAWADGQWYFLGACEPEPVLDLGWFNSPASRGMLMNTKVFGHYDGPEEVIERQPTATVINVTSKYAPVAETHVRVTDAEGHPVENATVAFRLYNYAEYFQLAAKKSDAGGMASLTSGKGDIIVWASKDDAFGFAKVSAGDGATAEVRLDKCAGFSGEFDFDIVPPAGGGLLPQTTAAQVAENDRRKQYEDSVRSAYEATFVTDDALLSRTRGNHAAVSAFLSHPSVTDREKAMALLSAISDKDLRDVPLEVLLDHYVNSPASDSPLFAEYVLNPRVEFELLTPYRSYLQSNMAQYGISSPGQLVSWVSDNIAIDSIWNPIGLRMSPQAVYEQRLADSRSRDIFFVAAARSLGFPTRIDPVTGKTQYAAGGDWTDVRFGTAADSGVSAPKGTLKINYKKSGRIDDPAYFSHFTISAIDGGQPRLLEFGDFAPLSEIAPDGMLTLDAGDYVLTSGQRLASGGVLARSQFFSIAPSDTLRLEMSIRQDTTAVQVIGSFNSENLYHDLASATGKSLLSTTGRGYYVLGLINPNHEPSSHALNDIAARRAEFEACGLKLMLLFPDAAAA